MTNVANRIDTTSQGGVFLGTREVKKTKEGIKIRLYGQKAMGHSYFQKYTKDDGSESTRVVRSKKFPEMENQSEGYQGAVQKPATCLYSIAWDYEQERPVVVTLDKLGIINDVFAVEDSKDLGSMDDYDFRITFDEKESPAKKYKVVRLDKTDLTPEQEKQLKAFTAGIDMVKYSEGEKIEITEVSAEAPKTDIPESTDDLPF